MCLDTFHVHCSMETSAKAAKTLCDNTCHYNSDLPSTKKEDHGKFTGA